MQIYAKLCKKIMNNYEKITKKMQISLNYANILNNYEKYHKSMQMYTK